MHQMEFIYSLCYVSIEMWAFPLFLNLNSLYEADFIFFEQTSNSTNVSLLRSSAWWCVNVHDENPIKSIPVL